MSGALVTIIGVLYAWAGIAAAAKGNVWIALFLGTLSILQFVQVKAFNL